MPPGWRPPDVAARFPKPPFALETVQRYDPPVSAPRQAVALALFALLLGATTAFLWTAHTLPLAQQSAAAAAIVAGLWAVGMLTETRTAVSPAA